jgi:hypothetical protein
VANTFTFTISAVDKATATVRKVNDSIGRMTRPFEDVGKSFKSLGRELGFEKIGKNLTAIGREAEGAARGVGAIVAPLAAITGIGSVAGIVSLATSWASLGRSIDNSSHSIGISATQLQGFQGAAKLVGVDTATTTASLEGLATTMQDAKWGRNQGALQLLNKLGIGLKQTKDGAWDVVGEYKAIANAIASQKNPQTQALIANNLGLGGMLPFLREGAAGIERYEETVKRLGYVMDESAVRRGKDFAQSLAGLEIAVDGTKNAIGDSLTPVIKPLVDDFANWLAVNRQLIATDIAGWVKGFATWINTIDWKSIGNGMVNFVKGIGDVVEWLGGWKTTALVVAGVMSASLIVSVVSLGANLVMAGVGIVSFVGLLWKWQAAAVAATEAQTALGAASTAKGLLGKAGLVGLAGAAGYGVGTVINDKFIEGTSFQDKLGEYLVRGAAAVGVGSAQESVAATDISKGVVPGGRDGADKVTKFFMGQGWTKEQAAGISANLGAESNYNPGTTGDNGQAYGLGQWHKDRQKDFENWAGKGIRGSSQDEQLRFVQYELTQGKESAAGDALRAAKTAQEAGAVVSRKYERPGVDEEAKSREARLRGLLASKLANPADLPTSNSPAPASAPPLANPTTLSKPEPSAQPATTAAPAPAPAAPTPAPQGPITSNTAEPANGKLHLEIAHVNAPEGTKSRLKDEGNFLASSRISYSGVGGNIA